MKHKVTNRAWRDVRGNMIARPARIPQGVSVRDFYRSGRSHFRFCQRVGLSTNEFSSWSVPACWVIDPVVSGNGNRGRKLRARLLRVSGKDFGPEFFRTRSQHVYK